MSCRFTGSNGTAWPEMVSLRPHQPDGFDANHIHYGVREFGMSAIMNGMQLHQGFRVFGGTFLAFMIMRAQIVCINACACYLYLHA